MKSGLCFREHAIVRCDAILFDLDGVLADAKPTVERLWSRFAARHRLDVRALLADLHGRRMVDTIRVALPDLAPEGLAREIRLMEDEEVEVSSSVDAMSGAIELTLALSGVSWAVATSCTPSVAQARIRAAGLPQPPVLVTADDVERGKPAPDPYLLAARRLGVAPEACVVVEDAPAGLHAGRAAGAVTIAVTTSFPRSALPPADFVVASVAELRVASCVPRVTLQLPGGSGS